LNLLFEDNHLKNIIRGRVTNYLPRLGMY